MRERMQRALPFYSISLRPSPGVRELGRNTRSVKASCRRGKLLDLRLSSIFARKEHPLRPFSYSSLECSLFHRLNSSKFWLVLSVRSILALSFLQTHLNTTAFKHAPSRNFNKPRDVCLFNSTSAPIYKPIGKAKVCILKYVHAVCVRAYTCVCFSHLRSFSLGKYLEVWGRFKI